LERGESEKALCAITKAIAARENMFKIETGLKKTLRDIKSTEKELTNNLCV